MTQEFAYIPTKELYKRCLNNLSHSLTKSNGLANSFINEQLFVKKYQLALPDAQQLENFLKQELKNRAL